MNTFLLGLITGLIIGAILGGFLVFKFNPKDVVMNGKYKAKRGGILNFKNIFTKDK